MDGGGEDPAERKHQESRRDQRGHPARGPIRRRDGLVLGCTVSFVSCLGVIKNSKQKGGDRSFTDMCSKGKWRQTTRVSWTVAVNASREIQGGLLVGKCVLSLLCFERRGSESRFQLVKQAFPSFFSSLPPFLTLQWPLNIVVSSEKFSGPHRQIWISSASPAMPLSLGVLELHFLCP